MGLNAAVFWSDEHMPSDLLPHMFVRDETNGECCTVEGFDERYSEFQACEKRLTNAFGAAALRDELRSFGLAEDGVLLSKVLYSGSHFGDHIAMGELGALRMEMASIPANVSEELTEFLVDMGELVAASVRESNPIVFV